MNDNKYIPDSVVGNKVRAVREKLLSLMSTIDSDPITGERIQTDHTSRVSFLAHFEVEKIMELVRDAVNSGIEIN